MRPCRAILLIRRPSQSARFQAVVEAKQHSQTFAAPARSPLDVASPPDQDSFAKPGLPMAAIAHGRTRDTVHRPRHRVQKRTPSKFSDVAHLYLFAVATTERQPLFFL